MHARDGVLRDQRHRTVGPALFEGALWRVVVTRQCTR